MRGWLKQTTFYLALAVTAGFAATAQAEEFDEQPVEYSWSGFYIGGYAGMGAQVAREELEIAGLLIEFDTDSHGDDGFLGGALLGFNWQVSDRFVIGLQGDIAFPDMESGSVFSESEFGADFIVSASLRAGLLVTADSLLYAIGGYSYGEFDNKSPEPVLDFDNEGYEGYHVGAGLETRLTDRFTARIEYRYTAFGGEDPIGLPNDAGGFEQTPHIHSGTLGLAYNLFPTPGDGVEASPAADVVEPAVTWTGLYIGASGGAGTLLSNNNGFGDGDEELDSAGEGFLGSLMAGFNFQVGERLVLGVQGDIGLADMDWKFEVSSGPTNIELKDRLDWFASASLRAGWLPTPETMLYVIGGYSYAEAEVEVDFQTAALSLQDSEKEGIDGYHIGAGAEAMLTESLTARVEYRYTDYGRGEFSLFSTVGGVGFEEGEFEHVTHTGTIGLAWLFN